MANYTLRNNSVRIRVFTGYNSAGKQIVTAKTFPLPESLTDKQRDKEIQRLAVLFEEQVKSGNYIDENIKFSDFVDRWMKDYAEKNLRIKTISGYKVLLPRINTEIGHIKLCDLRPMHLNDLYKKIDEQGNQKIAQRMEHLNNKIKKMKQEGRPAEKIKRVKDELKSLKPRGVNPNTIRAYHRLISSILSKAVKWQVIMSNPAERAEPPKYKPVEAKYLEEADAVKLLSLLDKEPIKYRTMIALDLLSGLRRGEFLGLRWSDIDFEHETVSVKKTSNYAPGYGIYEDTTKNQSSTRPIKLPLIAFEYLRSYHLWQIEQRFIAGDRWKDTDKVFTKDDGSPIHPDTITNWFTDFIKNSGMPKVTVHSLRHTYANLMIYSGIPLKTVSQRLGHANSSTTQNIYSHMFRSADERAAEAVGSYFLNTNINA